MNLDLLRMTSVVFGLAIASGAFSQTCPPEAVQYDRSFVISTPAKPEDLGSLSGISSTSKDLLQRLYLAHSERSAARPDRSFTPDIALDKLDQVEPSRGKKSPCLRADAASAARALLSKARTDFEKAHPGRRVLAQQMVVSSGYRSTSYQAKLWVNSVVTQYMPHQGISPNDRVPSGSAKFRKLLDGTACCQAAPGYSNHQTGTGLDFTAVDPDVGVLAISTKDANVARWKRSWFHEWLKKNAKRFGFAPYAVEPWHWNFIGIPQQARAVGA